MTPIRPKYVIYIKKLDRINTLKQVTATFD